MSRKKNTFDKIEIEISDQEINRRLDEIEAANISEDLRNYLINVLKVLVELDRLVGLQQTTIARLRKVFGKKSEKRILEGNKGQNPKDPNGSKDKSKGHGRNGHDDYQNIPGKSYEVEEQQIGDSCPKCEKGKLYDYKPRYHILITGGAPFQARKCIHQVLRCSVCGWTIEAKSEATGKPKYDLTVSSMLAILHYSASFPFYRLEKLQKMLFIPMPRSVQWILTYELSLKVRPIWDTLIKLMENSSSIMSDDTGAKIQSHIKRKKEKGKDKNRVKLSTTGMRALTDDHEIFIYFTGEKNSGENIDDILGRRKSEDPLTLMTDASSSNNPTNKKFINHLKCLVHARRNFIDIESKFEEETTMVINWIKLVYDNEEMAKIKDLNAQERLKWHQEKSSTPMNELKAWCDSAFSEKKTEPNSSLGKAIQYMINHWEGLTGFLRIEGAPLDTNILEQNLRTQVMNRKNWLSFKTPNGALVNDIVCSLIRTCEKAGKNPFEYLNSIQLYEKEVNSNPENWLPWNYKKNL